MKKETWRTVTVQDPDTKHWLRLSVRGKSCPNCGQSRCTRQSALCKAVQAAIKAGNYETKTHIVS